VKGRKNIRWGLAWRTSRKWREIWLMGRSIYPIHILKMLLGERGGITDCVLMACVNFPTWITFPFNGLNHQETLQKPHELSDGSIPCSYVRASTGFGNMETFSNCHSSPSTCLTDVNVVLFKKVIYVDYEICYMLYTLY
jgi:hypothetical protein